MKVGVVAEWMDRSRGGAEWSTSQFIDALLERGITIELLTRSRAPSAPGLCVRTVETPRWPRSAGTAGFLAAAEAYARETDCDIVHTMIPCEGAHVYQPRGGLVAETIARTLASRPEGLPRMIKRLDLAMNRRQRLLLKKERSWLTGSHKPAVIAISNYVARQLRDHHDYPDELIYRIPNGVSIVPADEKARVAERAMIRRRHGIADEAFVMLAVCHHFRLKGVGRLIEALGRVVGRTGSPIRAVVVGRDRVEPWKLVASRHRVGDAVVFTGPVESVRPYYHAADVLVHASYYDPCSRVVLEAMQYGLMVVTTVFDGASEQVVDGTTGFVIASPDDTDELVRVLMSIMERWRQKRASAGPASASGRWTMQGHADEVLSVYRLLRGTGGRGRSAGHGEVGEGVGSTCQMGD
ncbi:MAG: glycosyltransferase family 4 protein [Phycisphaerales bacterium]|nr:glycosyltransferase family 4 protein [Phycisphaerales bacterium]